jgi:DNA-binding response OmpR family regulator
LLIVDARLLTNHIPEDVIERFHLWRRHGGHYHPHGPVEPSAERLALDPASFTVRVGDRVTTLTRTEFAILVMLLQHRGQAVTRDELFDAVEHQGAPFDRVVDRHICNLRHKIDVHPEAPSLIETIRGIGYRIDT